MSAPILYIGNKNYSSWSMRPWLALTWAGIAFEERIIPLGAMGYGKSRVGEILAVSPSGRVPALHVGDAVIWDSLAIGEWAAEQAPGALWPHDPLDRALARSAIAEMHAGFAGLRRDAAMNIRRRAGSRAWPEETQADIARLQELWGALRGAFAGGGPFLFGRRSLADAFFAPVCTRLRTYAIAVDAVSQAYCDTILDDESFQQWERDAVAETWTLPPTDAL